MSSPQETGKNENDPSRAEYWTQRYREQNTNWDVGYPTTPLTAYFDQLKHKNIHILIPGCGRAYEGEYLHKNGFTNVWLADISLAPREEFLQANPGFHAERYLLESFFVLRGQYDLIVEQTFFSAIKPDYRDNYAQQMHRLLKPGGKLVGLLFDDPLFEDHPPFGGSREEYLPFFEKHFEIEKFETAYNSIPPRAGRELFILLRKGG